MTTDSPAGLAAAPASSAEYYIEKLRLEPHPEGGWYRESLKSPQKLAADALPGFAGGRRLWSSIYFLLERCDASHFHRLRSDEVWYFHAGSPLTIAMISPQGELEQRRLGLDLARGELPQVLVPAGYIFGSCLDEGAFSLVGCMVAPGFEFADFCLFSRAELLSRYPYYHDVIQRLTRDS